MFFMHIKFVHKIHFIHSNAVYIMRYTHHSQWQNQKRWIASVHHNADFLHLLSAVKPLWITCQAKGFRWRKTDSKRKLRLRAKPQHPPLKQKKFQPKCQKRRLINGIALHPEHQRHQKAGDWASPLKFSKPGMLGLWIAWWAPEQMASAMVSEAHLAYVCWETKQSVWKPHQTLYIWNYICTLKKP